MRKTIVVLLMVALAVLGLSGFAAAGPPGHVLSMLVSDGLVPALVEAGKAFREISAGLDYKSYLRETFGVEATTGHYIDRYTVEARLIKKSSGVNLRTMGGGGSLAYCQS